MTDEEKLLVYDLIQTLLLERFTEGHIYDPVAASRNVARRITIALDEQGFMLQREGLDDE